MKANTIMKSLLRVILFGFYTFVSSVYGADGPAPVRLDPDKIAGLGLTSVPPDAYSDILVAGELNMNVATLFDGTELRVSIFESTPATTDHRTRPTDVDEFVTVLSAN